MRVVGLAALLVLAACPKAATYDYFVLSPAVEVEAPREAEPDEQAAVLVIGEVALPGYLDRDSLVTRVGDSQLVYSTTERWAEPLEVGFERALRQNLAGQLEGSAISVQRQRVGTGPDYKVAVDVLRFERTGAERVELWARWSIRADGRVLRSGDARIAEPTRGADARATAAAHDRAVARLSQDIAREALALEPTAAIDVGDDSPGVR